MAEQASIQVDFGSARLRLGFEGPRNGRKFELCLGGNMVGVGGSDELRRLKAAIDALLAYHDAVVSPPEGSS